MAFSTFSLLGLGGWNCTWSSDSLLFCSNTRSRFIHCLPKNRCAVIAYFAQLRRQTTTSEVEATSANEHADQQALILGPAALDYLRLQWRTSGL